MKYVTGFGRFWWDFLVGDTPELFVGAGIVMVVGALIHRTAVVAAFVVPTCVIALLALSVQRGRAH